MPTLTRRNVECQITNVLLQGQKDYISVLDKIVSTWTNCVIHIKGSIARLITEVYEVVSDTTLLTYSVQSMTFKLGKKEPVRL